MKKQLLLLLALLLCLSACGGDPQEITVITREEGSGTRSAFTELSGVAEKGMDKTYPRAEVSSSTAVVLQTVMGNKNAIGYISLSALQRGIKALSIDGVAASEKTVSEGSYPLARPFLLATGERPSEQAADFLAFLLSEDGQELVRQAGYVPVSAGSYQSRELSGILRISGSSSVAPVMERLAERYMALNPHLQVQIQTSDSSTGLSALSQGLCDIAMSSRSLKDSERAKGLEATTLCMDGIAVIVNQSNPVSNLSMVQLRAIFTGQLGSWALIS